MLAASGSSRLGRPKQLVVVQSESLVHRAASRVLGASCESVALVVGARAAEVASLPVAIVPNKDWSSGRASSLYAAVR